VSTDSRETQQTTSPVKLVQQDRSELVRQADIDAITSFRGAKSFATNQGVKGHVENVRSELKQEIGKSELATALAMQEVFAQLSAQLADLGDAFHQLHDAFDQVARVQQQQHSDEFKRLFALESRWWERLMRDFETDVRHIRDWTMALFGKVAKFIPTYVDPDFVDVTPFLVEETLEAHHARADAQPDQAAPFLPKNEWTTCACGHLAEQHEFTASGKCTAEGCQCSAYVSVGSTLPPDSKVSL
jgi:hypothetical protein